MEWLVQSHRPGGFIGVGRGEKAAAGSSRTGYITLSVTNQSPATITMQDQFKTLDAASFVPSGSYKLDGGVGSIQSGNFNILGVARAYLDPEVGVGIPPGTLSGGTSGRVWHGPARNSGHKLASVLQLELLPLAFSKSSFMNSCPSYGVPTALTPCVESVVDDLGPIKVESVINDVMPKSFLQSSTTDPQKIQDAQKRLKDATEKDDAAFQNIISADKGVKSAFQAGLDKADPTLQANLQQAEQSLAKAKEANANAVATQDATPTKENENAQLYAATDEMEADSAVNAARKDVIDSFDEDTKKAYDEAVQDSNKAAEEAGADNAKREHTMPCKNPPADGDYKIDVRDALRSIQARLPCPAHPTTEAAGSVNRNLLPLPTVLSAQMRPPCCSTMLRQSARPSPVPPRARESLASPCWKRSKIRSSFSGAMPRPWSSTIKQTSPAPEAMVPASCAAIRMVVSGGENLMALVTSSFSTCSTAPRPQTPAWTGHRCGSRSWPRSRVVRNVGSAAQQVHGVYRLARAAAPALLHAVKVQNVVHQANQPVAVADGHLDHLPLLFRPLVQRARRNQSQ